MRELKSRVRPLFRNERVRIFFSSLILCVVFIVGWVIAACGFLAILYLMGIRLPASCNASMWGTDGTYSVSPGFFLVLEYLHVL